MTGLSPALVSSPSAAREVLDSFSVPARLRHVRDFIWRGGDIALHLDTATCAEVFYELYADWDTAILAPTPGAVGLESAHRAVVEGQWRRARAGYVLRVGINFNAPSVIHIWAGRPLASVPFLRRPPATVEGALAADLGRYVEWFLDHCVPVPQARASASEQLARLHLSDASASDKG
ncbi:MAG TPA: hypothetical protein VGQ62_13535 [Chloroflexota bacterium]|nr:hypothetical protein [Chloroflexota bacterium]